MSLHLGIHIRCIPRKNIHVVASTKLQQKESFVGAPHYGSQLTKRTFLFLHLESLHVLSVHLQNCNHSFYTKNKPVLQRAHRVKLCAQTLTDFMHCSI